MLEKFGCFCFLSVGEKQKELGNDKNSNDKNIERTRRSYRMGFERLMFECLPFFLGGKDSYSYFNFLSNGHLEHSDQEFCPFWWSFLKKDPTCFCYCHEASHSKCLKSGNARKKSGLGTTVIFQHSYDVCDILFMASQPTPTPLT